MITTGAVINTSFDDLKERVEIVRKTETRDTEGNIIRGSPSVLASCYAKVLPMASVIRDGYSETVNQVTYRVIIRYREGVRPTDYLKWRGKTLVMTAPPYDAESGHVYTVMECKELIENV